MINWLYFQILLLYSFTAKWVTKLKLMRLLMELIPYTAISILYLSLFFKILFFCICQLSRSTPFLFSVLLTLSFVTISIFYIKKKGFTIHCSIAKLQMIDKTNGQRMQYNPGNILPGGLVMDYCLGWMSTLSLIIISLAVLF